MSAGELFDLMRPAVVVASAIISTWVLISARKRFRFFNAFLIAIATFFLPFVVLPLYLVFLLIWRPVPVRTVKHWFTIPLAFLATILLIFFVYTYVDDRSIDAHLARASFAKASSDPITAIHEYQEALKLEDSAHTHKLLAETLDDAGFVMEAITEFRTAELAGEPDDLIHFRLAVLLGRINHPGEAILEFRQFAFSKTCLQVDERCEAARQRIEDAERSPVALRTQSGCNIPSTAFCFSSSLAISSGVF